MKDEMYIFISDVKEKGSIARSGGKRGKSRYGCRLPSDNLSTKEKKQMNGEVISFNMDRPISFEKFSSLSTESKKTYLQYIIDTYGGTTNRISKMFDITEAAVKKLRNDLNIITPHITPEDRWDEFLSLSEFLKKPMNWESFKKLDKYDKQSYLDYIYKECFGKTTEILKMFGLKNSSIFYNYLKNNKLIVASSNSKRTEGEYDIWKSFIYSSEPSDSTDIPNIEKCEVGTDLSQCDDFCKEIQLSITVDSFNNISKILASIPKVKKGKILFIFGY